MARLEPHKGIDVALRAVAAARSGGLDLHYLVIGQGKKGKEYRRLANELGIGDVVRFTGNVPDRDLPALYNTAQVYLGISRRADMSRVEGFGVALAEASACGLPVIAGKSGGLAEAVKDGDTGFVVEPTDVDAVTVTLRRLLDDQLLARRVGQAARKSVESYYNWDRVIRDLREIESQVT